MTKSKKWVAAALGVAACLGLVFLLATFVADKPAAPAVASVAGKGQVPVDGTMYGQALPAPAASWPDLPGGQPAMESPLSTMSPPRFAADRQGRLVFDADTHANLEKFLLELDPKRRQANLERIVQGLPPQAAGELKVLLGQFEQYSKALAHTIPPDNAPETEQAGLKLLDQLHALRVSYLGADAAQAMFGAEEATARRLIALMAAQDDPNLTQQQKAERAQELLRMQSPPAPPPR
ncbi:hypothetical protein G4G28_04605 [Massilia sp. Dwa41.01b]|uniref:lipase secretion chaperone n=1 Tax=unclassified Massilia TaxID=2609279 RepID=UPI0015FFE68E|nr:MULTISPECIES: lipase secretion chaperone [unclassified Massilia]QNA87930.1 hypothetical protein G4G28_04605 [Massilia sp. Dwa41.01b]QNA98833.1 hypothetical protein G4G31_08325 [Massilia sp. Se16.2.3]